MRNIVEEDDVFSGQLLRFILRTAFLKLISNKIYILPKAKVNWNFRVRRERYFQDERGRIGRAIMFPKSDINFHTNLNKHAK